MDFRWVGRDGVVLPQVERCQTTIGDAQVCEAGVCGGYRWMDGCVDGTSERAAKLQCLTLLIVSLNFQY